MPSMPRRLMPYALFILVLGALCGLLAGGLAGWLSLLSAPTWAQATPYADAPLYPTLLPQAPPALQTRPPASPTITISAAPPSESETPLDAGPQITATLTQVAADILAPTVLAAGGDAWCLPWNAPVTRALVTDIRDGITIEVDLGGGQRQLVRYIGLALLDYSSDSSVWERSTEANRALVADQVVLLYGDVQAEDAYGVWLRYVLAGTQFVNQALVAQGYANVESQPPNTRCDALLLEAEGRAISAEIGLWRATPTATRTLIPLPSATIGALGEMVIVRVSRRGTIWEEPEEFVEIRNDSGGPLQLENWTLQDEQGHIFTFPPFVLGSDQYCRVFTNQYHPQSCGFSYYSQSPIWNNDFDCAYLKDAQGNLVSTLCYPPY